MCVYVVAILSFSIINRPVAKVVGRGGCDDPQFQKSTDETNCSEYFLFVVFVYYAFVCVKQRLRTLQFQKISQGDTVPSYGRDAPHEPTPARSGAWNLGPQYIETVLYAQPAYDPD